jgi:carboxypeptidase C (cathepsin A)
MIHYKMSIRTGIAALTFAASALAQYISPPTDLVNATGYANVPVRYKAVPSGICELHDNVKSYSGYVDVAEDQHIFFWFFEARVEDPTIAPLTIWIDGGPGTSSMVGLFDQNGPCIVSDDGATVKNNPNSK